MWDAAIIERVKARKLDEIAKYANLSKDDVLNLDVYIDIIVCLGDEIDACDILLDTDGEAEMELDPIEWSMYYESLNADERADEDYFNRLTRQYDPAEDLDLKEYVRDLIADAIASVKSESVDNEAMTVLKDELNDCRSRVDMLYADLEFAKAENKGLEDEIKELKAKLSSATGSISSLKTQLMIAEQKLAVLEPAYNDALKTIEDLKAQPEPEVVPEEIPVEPEPVVEEVQIEEPTSDEGMQYGNYLSPDQMRILKEVRDMKDAKIDSILDSDLNVDAMDDIIDFLKLDISICDHLLRIDFANKDSVVSGFKDIIRILEESKEPVHQDEYVASLTAEEAQIEYNYAQVLNSLQSMIMYLRDEVMEE